MKLTIELVPQTAWRKSLAQTLPKKVWLGIRESHIERNGKKCEICGETEGIFNLHEIWNYDDVNYLQKLEGFVLLCVMCHHVKHIGLAGILADEGKLDFNGVIAHFCRVNSCNERDFHEQEKEAFSVWRMRSSHNWRQDFGEYAKFLQK
jgi:hypothetical protein